MRRRSFVLLLFLCIAFSGRGQSTLGQRPGDVHFQSGLDRMEHHQYGAAFLSFSKFLETRDPADPRTQEAEYAKAYCAVTLMHSDGEKLMTDFVTKNATHPRAVMAYYDLANFFYDEKNYSKAGNYFSKVVFHSLGEEQSMTGRFRWGYSLFSQRNLLEAMDQFNVVKPTGGQYGPAASYYAGFIELSVGDFNNALIDFKRAEKSPSYATIVPPLMATTYQRMGKDDELIAYVTPLLDKEDMPVDDLSLLIAEAWFRKGNYGNAFPGYAEYLEGRESAARPVYYRAGYSAWSLSNDEQALRYLKQAASDEDSLGMYASYLLGSVYLKRQEKPLALTAFETSKKFVQDPRLAEESLFLSAKINYELGRPDVAISEFERVLEQYPQTVHAQEIKELLAQAYINANNVNKAMAYIESLPHRSTAVDRAYQKATYLKGTEYFNKEEYAQAASLFEKSLEFPLDNRFVTEASYWLGETYSIGKRYEEAVPHYEKALTTPGAPSNLILPIRYGLGYAHYNLQHYDKALISFREYASKGNREPDYVDGLLRLADCQYVLKSYGEALRSYRKVIDLKSIDSEYAHLQAGNILSIQRQFVQAEAELSLVAKNAGSRYADEARFQLGQIDLERGNYPSAVNHFTILINTAQVTRYVPYAYTRRASANYNLKNYSQTADDYIAVIQKFPAHPAGEDILLPLEEALRLSGRQEEFRNYLALYKQANPDAKGLEAVEFETAKNLYFNQQYPQAIDGLSAFMKNYPQSVHAAEATYYEAEAHYRLKDYLKSLDLLQQLSTDNSFTMISKVVSRKAELEFKLQRYDAAVSSYSRLKQMATNKKEEHLALNGLMESYFLLASYDSADTYARKIQQLGSVNANALGKASLFLGKSAKARGDYDTAKDEFLNTFNNAQDEYGAEAKYLLAEVFYLTGDHKMCFETLISLNQDFAAYEDWVGKSFLLLADNYLATNEIFQAKATLKSLIDNFPKPEVRTLAAEKLRKIETQELEKKQSQKDTTDHKP